MNNLVVWPLITGLYPYPNIVHILQIKVMESPNTPSFLNLPEAKIRRCRKSVSELEDCFLDDPEPDTVFTTSEIESPKLEMRYKEVVQISREYRPRRESHEISAFRPDGKTTAFTKNRRHSASVVMEITPVTTRHTSSIYVYPKTKAYTSTLSHELPTYTRCWSVSDAECDTLDMQRTPLK